MSLVLLILALTILLVVVWNVLAWPGFKAAEPVHNRLVSVLIPARNEEANLARCIETVLEQGDIVLEVLIYDDHSSDATPEIIREYERRDGRVCLVAAEELPGGWCGKNFACAQLARAAKGQWLLFLDADARLADGGVQKMVEEARRRRVTLISAWPALILESFWEKALMPLLNFVVFTIYPAPLSLARTDASLGIAHGACIMVDRLVYGRVGGHSSVRDQIFEDVRLAQLWRAEGNRGLCLDGQHIVCVRMYTSLREIWFGFQKNFFPAFRQELSFWAFLALHFVVFLLPFLLAGWTGGWSMRLAVASILAMRLLLALRFHHPLWSALLHPVAEIILIALGLSSWWRSKSGKGVEWKGRRYQ